MTRENKLLFIEKNVYKDMNGEKVQIGGNFHLGIRVPASVDITAEDIKDIRKDALTSSDIEYILQKEFDRDIHKCGGIILPRDMTLSSDNVSFFSEGDSATSKEELEDLAYLLDEVNSKMESLAEVRDEIAAKVRRMTQGNGKR